MPLIHVFFEEFILSLKTITLSDYNCNVGTFIHTFPPVLESLGLCLLDVHHRSDLVFQEIMLAFSKGMHCAKVLLVVLNP